MCRRETSRTGSGSSWFAIRSSALGKEAVDGKDGYAILTLPATTHSKDFVPGDIKRTDGAIGSQNGRHSICWEFVGATVT